MYVAYYLHWPLEHILGLEHPARRRVIEEISGIHRELNDADQVTSSGW